MFGWRLARMAASSHEYNDSWMENGIGSAPLREWSFRTDGALVAVARGLESGETVAADNAGGLYWFDATGELGQVSRGLEGVLDVAMSALGNVAVVAYNHSRLAWLDDRLSTAWSIELHNNITSIAVDPFGRHVAVGLADRLVRIYSSRRRVLSEFETVRPLHYLSFCATEPLLIGGADHGVLAAYEMSGQLRWDTRLWSACGDMTTNGDCDTIFLAAFAHGVQRYDGAGSNRGTYVLEGTPMRVSVNFEGSRLVVSTVERHLYRLDGQGRMLWAAQAPEDITTVVSDATGGRMLVGMKSGQLLQLSWEP